LLCTACAARTADNLKYKFMVAYDRAIMHLDKAFGFVAAPHSWVSRKDEGDKIIVLERGECLGGLWLCLIWCVLGLVGLWGRLLGWPEVTLTGCTDVLHCVVV
jgi:hypothetical protein